MPCARTASERSPTRSRSAWYAPFVGMLERGGPEREPLVVLGREHDVVGAGLLADAGEGIEVGIA